MRPSMKVALVAVVILVAGPAHAQHEGHAMAHAMAGPLDVPMQRNASGTSWEPDATPMFGWQAMAGGWMLMLHTSLFVGYDAQVGDEPGRQGLAHGEHGDR